MYDIGMVVESRQRDTKGLFQALHTLPAKATANDWQGDNRPSYDTERWEMETVTGINISIAKEVGRRRSCDRR